MRYSRREFGKLTLAALPATSLMLDSDVAAATTLDKPNSRWAGVQVGMNVPYNFKAGNYMSGDEILKRCVALNVSGVELRAQPVELFLGSPAALRAASASQGRGGGRGAETPEQRAAAQADAVSTRTWRMGVSMEKVKAFRTFWDDAGVHIDVVKWDGIFDFSDDEIDYAFEVSKALGAKALSSEIAVGRTKRLGSFADRHRMPVGYHGHTTVSDEIWEATFAEAKYNYANVDLGHYVAGQNKSPVAFIKKYPDRITHVHVKDRKLHDGPNMPFGEGETPIKEVLQLMRANKWAFDATVEFEYPVPRSSDLMTELARTMQYCRDCLS